MPLHHHQYNFQVCGYVLIHQSNSKCDIVTSLGSELERDRHIWRLPIIVVDMLGTVTEYTEAAPPWPGNRKSQRFGSNKISIPTLAASQYHGPNASQRKQGDTAVE